MGAEERLLGSLMLSDRSIGLSLSSDDFAKPTHADIYRAIVSIAEGGDTPVPELVASRFTDRRVKTYVAELVAQGDSRRVYEYAEAVARESRERALQLVAVEIAAEGDTDEKVHDALTKLSSLGSHAARARSVEDILAETVPTFRDKRETFGLIEWGIRLRAGTVTVVGGRRGVGKSAFALQAADELASRHVRCRVYSYEMTDEDWAARIIQRKAGFGVERLENGIGESGVAYVMERMTGDWARFISVLMAAPLKLNQVLSDMSAFARSGGRVAFVDYLQLMVENDYAEVTRASRALKLAAMSTGLAIVAVSQVKRAMSESGVEREPALSDLKQSGAIENDADLVALLHAFDTKDLKVRERLSQGGFLINDPSHSTHRLSQVHIAKNRRGPEGRRIPAWFDGSEMRWEAVDQEQR